MSVNVSNNLCIRISCKTRDKLEKIAPKKGMKSTQYARFIIENYLNTIDWFIRKRRFDAMQCNANNMRRFFYGYSRFDIKYFT